MDNASIELGSWVTPLVEPTPRWIRVRFAGAWIADSRRALLLLRYGPNALPTYYLPLADVGSAPSSLRQDPPPSLPELAGHVTFPWDGGVEWYEEDEQVRVHARDPHKRVDVLRSTRHVRVGIDGQTVAETTRPSLLFETWLPTRYYIPADDVRMDLLEPSATTTYCPYKGAARYWSARLGERLVKDIVWSYPDPIPENPKIRDLLCFFNEHVDLVVDGESLPRPQTPWS